MDVVSSLVLITPHLVSALGCYFLYVTLREALFGKVPSSPAAIGRSLGVIILGQLVLFYLLWYFSYLLGYLGVTFTDPNHSVLHGPIGIVFIVMAGYLSARTFEDTKSMNLKIVCVVGLIPQLLITVFNFNEGLSASIALYLFIPSVLIGGYLSKYTSCKRMNSDLL
jgi:hypothetical protein